MILDCIGLSTYEFIVSRRQTKDLELENKTSLISSSLSKLNLSSGSIQLTRWFRWCCHDQNDEKTQKVKVNGSTVVSNTNDSDSKSVATNETTIVSNKSHVNQNLLTGSYQMNGSSLFERLTSASATWNQQQNQLNKQNGSILKDPKVEPLDDNCNNLNTDLYIKSIQNHRSSMLRNSWLNGHRSFEESHGEVYLGSPERRFWESLRTNILPANGLPYNQLTLNNAKNSIDSEQSTHNSNVNSIENIPHYQIPSKEIHVHQDNTNVTKLNGSQLNSNDKLSYSLQSTEPIFTPIHFRSNLINGRTSRLSFVPKLIDSTPTTLSTTSDVSIIDTTAADNAIANNTVNLISNLPSSNLIETGVDKSIVVNNSSRQFNSKLMVKSKSIEQRSESLLNGRQSTQSNILTGIDRSFKSISNDNLRENLRNQLLNENREKFIPRRATIDEIKPADNQNDRDCQLSSNIQDISNVDSMDKGSSEGNQIVSTRNNSQIKRIQSNVEISSQF